MKKFLKGRRFSPSMIVAMVALFVALGPSAYATHLVVNGSDVTDGSLTGDDIRGRSATSSTIVVHGSLTEHDISGQQGNSARGQPFVAGSLTGWDVADSSLGGADIADGTIRGPDVLESTLSKVPDADKLDGYGADQLSRVSYASSPASEYGEHGRSTLKSVTLVAPQQGFVTLMGSATGGMSGCSGFCSMHLRFRAWATEHAVASGTVPSDGGSGRLALSTVVTIPVAGGTHTFELIGSWYGPTTNWSDSSLSALYTPFSGSGGTTASAAAANDASTRPAAPDVKRADD